MVLKIENDSIRIKVSTLGAELQGIYSKITHKEYMWQPGHDAWNHSSLFLFPTPGRVSGNRIIVRGKEYPATMHGFAKDLDFYVLKQGKEDLVLEYTSDNVTKEFLPYEYRLQIEFCLKNDILYKSLRVINDDSEPIYFSIGTHPGFYCPINLNETADDYSLYFDSPQTLYKQILQENTKLRLGEQIYLNNESEIPLSESMFDHGAIILSEVKAKTITLRSKKSGVFVEIGIEKFPFLCLWGMPTRCYFICIEPWCGVSESADTDHVWETRYGNEKAETKETIERTMTFRVG